MKKGYLRAVCINAALDGLVGQEELSRSIHCSLQVKVWRRRDLAGDLALSAGAGELALRSLGYADSDADDVVNRLRKSDVERLDQQITAARDERGREDIVLAITPEPVKGRKPDIRLLSKSAGNLFHRRAEFEKP
ncbi:MULTISPECIES: hypothetical protein [Sulfitobacter]|uniref:Uncharacterized protein n=1 Tax=Sulfitobacter profundi TaxID=2679961 RepID=A0ABW1Z2H0_9RHOB|nr:hypothetical protein [Sulfitobacter indolifex]